jgi:hypothetical protein
VRRRPSNSVHVLLVALIFLSPLMPAFGQLWKEFSHIDSPHVIFLDSPISIPPLVDNVNRVITVSVLIILLDYANVRHHTTVHTPQFFSDFVFGSGTANDPSVHQIIQANSNGRLLLVPAFETHGTANDGIVGWVTTQCPPGETEGVCIAGTPLCTLGTAGGSRCTVGTPGACGAGEQCWSCDSQQYYSFEGGGKKRAEAIRRANPFVNFASYDTMNSSWTSGPDTWVTNNELLVMVIEAWPDCVDGHGGAGHIGWGQCGCDGGQTAEMNPQNLSLDGVSVRQRPAFITEAATPQTLAHELAHQLFGLEDLYGEGDPNQCNPRIVALEGAICYPCTMGQTACNDSCANAACLDDMALFATNSRSVSGSTNGSAGSDVTSCGVNDSADVWFEYTPAVSGNVTVSLCTTGCGDGGNPPLDTTLAIFNGCGGTQLVGACSDNFDCDNDGIVSPINNFCDRHGEITAFLNADTTYAIRVAGAAGATGSYNLQLFGGGGLCHNVRDNRWRPQAPGVFSMMDNQSLAMPQLDPWAKIHLGFVQPVVALEDGTYTLFDEATERSFAQQTGQPEAIVIHDPQWPNAYDQYFILENREVVDRDGSILDRGLAVWSIRDIPFPGEGSLFSPRAIHLVRPLLWPGYNTCFLDSPPFTDTGRWCARRSDCWFGESCRTRGLWDGSDASYYDLTVDSFPKNTEWPVGGPSYIEIYDVSAPGSTMTVKIRLPGVFVDRAYIGVETGSQSSPYNTLPEAVNKVRADGLNKTIRIAGGSYPVRNYVIDVPLTLKGWRNGAAIIGQ